MNAFLNNGNRPASSNFAASLLNSKTSSCIKESSKRMRLTTEEPIASALLQSVDVTGINMDDNETTSGSIGSDGYDYYYVPEGIFHQQHNGGKWIHKMYLKLKTPLNSGTLTKENICIPCCFNLDGKPRYSHAWKKFMKISALENMKKHIQIVHPELIPAKPSRQKEVANKQSKYKGTESMSMVS